MKIANATFNWLGSADQKRRFWSVSRMLVEDGSVYPIRLTFQLREPPAAVTAYIIARQLADDPEWKPYRIFDLDPGPVNGWK